MFTVEDMGEEMKTMQEKRDLGADNYVDQWGDGNDTITQDWMHSAYQNGWDACLTELSSCDLEQEIEAEATKFATLECLASDHKEVDGLAHAGFKTGASFATQRVRAKMEKRIAELEKEIRIRSEVEASLDEKLSRLKAAGDKMAQTFYGKTCEEYVETVKELGL